MFCGALILWAGLALAQTPAPPSTLVFLGDSLTEGYGLSPEEAYPSKLELALKERGHSVRAVNAGISGATSASGPSRISWLLRSKPTVLVLALGANDALRGLKPEETRKNLAHVIREAQKQNVKILLAGMKAPPNYGKEYSRKFEDIYASLAKEFRGPLVPFILEGVGGEKDLNLPDGIHPNAKGQEKVASNLLPALEVLLKK